MIWSGPLKARDEIIKELKYGMSGPRKLGINLISKKVGNRRYPHGGRRWVAMTN